MANPICICDGDSITIAFGATTPYYDIITPNGGTWTFNSVAVSGDTLAQRYAAAPTAVDPLYNAIARPIVIIWAGTNDIEDGTTPAATYAIMANYVAARHAVGWKVIVATMLSREGLDTQKDEYNALILANTAGADGIADFSGTPLGIDNGWSNLTWFQSDGVHPTQGGINTYETAVMTLAMNTLTAKGPTAPQTPPPVLVQSNYGGTSNTTLEVPFSEPVSAGSMLCCYVWTFASVTNTVSDSLNGAWSSLPIINTAGISVQFFYLLDSQAGASTVLLNSSSTTLYMSTFEFSAVLALDTHASTANLSSATPTQAITTGVKNALLIGYTGNLSGPATIGAGTNMTEAIPNPLRGTYMDFGFGFAGAAGPTSLGFDASTSIGSALGVVSFAPKPPASGGSKGPNIFGTQIFGAEIITSAGITFGTGTRTRITK